MTNALAPTDIAAKLNSKYPDSASTDGESLLVAAENMPDAAAFLKDEPGIELDYLHNMTAADYPQYFEVVYNLSSISKQHSLTLKVRCTDKEKPSVPSVYSVWQGADFQEREIYDLMGVSFSGRPRMKRILLWDGFDGHPLRKDYQPQDISNWGFMYDS